MDAQHTGPTLLFMGDTSAHEPRKPEPNKGLTIKEFAAEWGVSERTVYSWKDKGALRILKTPGGRVRILGTK
jgi:excisionase family DNA binding protein